MKPAPSQEDFRPKRRRFVWFSGRIHVVGSQGVSNQRPSTILARRSLMPHRTTASIVGLVVAPLLVTHVIGVVQPRTRMVCVSATDKNGSAVADLQASEFQVKEG